MIFKELIIDGFGSYDKETISFDGTGLILIEGENKVSHKYDSNGSGKSTIPNALSWCLYGDMCKTISPDEVVNRHLKRGTVVQVTAMHPKTSDIYRVERYRKHNIEGNKVKLFINDKDFTCHKNVDTDKLIIQHFGKDFKQMLHTTVIGQGMQTKFSQLTNKYQLEIIESFTNTSMYEEARTNAWNCNKELQNKINECTIKLDELKANFDRFESLIVESKKPSDNCEYNEAELKKSKYIYESNLEYHEKSLCEIDSNIKELSKQHQKLLQLPGSGNKEKLQKLLLHRDNLEKTIAKYEKMIKAGKCISCGSAISNDKYREDNDIAFVEKDLLDANRIIPIIEQKINDENEEKSRKLLLLESSLKECETEKDHLNSKLKEFKEKLSDITLKLNTIAESNKLNEQHITNLTQQKDSIQTEIDKYTEKLNGLNKDVYKAKFWVDGFQEIRSLMLDRTFLLLNEQVSNFLSELSDNEFNVMFDASSGKIKTIITSDNGGSFSSTSGGEARRLDLAIQFALNEVSNTFSGNEDNILFCDEILDSLDSAGIESAVELLKKISANKTVFLISQDPRVKSLVETVWVVTKNKDRISRLSVL